MEPGAKVVTVMQGELSVSGDPTVVMSCILGSCVATCLYDPSARVGGMNHILLPGRRGEAVAHNKFGVFAMETLINELMHIGARKPKLVAKIFGGASTFDNGLAIGAANAAFVRDFLETESIPIAAESIGGRQARRVRFFPESGHAKQLLTAEAVPAEELRPQKPARDRRPAVPPGGSGEVELF
ncbi:chemotaxis protein CheD [Psychromarinibacter sp. C21-152]|uniref:Probable chemoreceptor glutamine deamidase CheD n=1 Tax=Psychromarinibacter sediminicola TaxID=3033385 RepID=A0AAE3NPJ0_9RHOB|nr:chemotaxis protein CheD [Psychromarinibacter sediminicola]MDF0600066.1 chemotaxis protein CheD [Psychromarinibacter sediminicola]